MFRYFKEKENSGLVEELPKSENKIDQANVMDISSHAVDEVEMQEPEVKDFDADGARNPHPSCGRVCMLTTSTNTAGMYASQLSSKLSSSSLSSSSHLESVNEEYLDRQTHLLPKMRAVLIGQENSCF